MRALAGDFTPKQHFGFEAAAWYWHFVDVVWLFLFMCIYVMRSRNAGPALITSPRPRYFTRGEGSQGAEPRYGPGRAQNDDLLARGRASRARCPRCGQGALFRTGLHCLRETRANAAA